MNCGWRRLRDIRLDDQVWAASTRRIAEGNVAAAVTVDVMHDRVC